MKRYTKVIALTLLISATSFFAGCNTHQPSAQFRNAEFGHTLFTSKDFPFGYVITLGWLSTEKIIMQGFSVIGPHYFPIYAGNVSSQTVRPVTFENNKATIIDGHFPVITQDGEYTAFLVYDTESGKQKIQIAEMPSEQDSALNLELINPIGSIDGNEVGSLVWNPDNNKQLAIFRLDKGKLTLSIYDRVDKTLITVFEYADNMARSVGSISAWSPDGEKLIFCLIYPANNHEFQADLYIYNFAEKRLARITKTPNKDEKYPSWNPSGKIFTYVSSRYKPPNPDDWDNTYMPGVSFLVFSNSDASCSKTFTELTDIISPSWSPSGKEIAFISEDGVEILDALKTFPEEFLSPEKLCLKD